MKIDIDPETQGMVQNSIAVLGLILIVVASLFLLKVEAKEIALTLGGGLVGFIGGARLGQKKSGM